MFLVQLRFSVNKPQAGAWMDDHKAWLQQGFDAGVFLVSGNLQPQAGGAILAHNTSLADLEARVAADPFVAHDVVTAEIIEFARSKTDARLAFLLG